jgi:hypothetical protein
LLRAGAAWDPHGAAAVARRNSWRGYLNDRYALSVAHEAIGGLLSHKR